MKKQISLILCCLFMLLPHARAQDMIAEGEVVVTIAPIHSLVSSVMKNIGKPDLLLESNISVHGVFLRPSQRQMLHDATLLFFIDEHFELFLASVIRQSPALQAEALSQTSGLILLPLREHEAHHHDHMYEHLDASPEEHDKPLIAQALDYHVWLSPDNAILMVKKIEQVLSEKYPQHKAVFEQNSLKLVADITARNVIWKAQLLPVKEKPFVVFHDAYQYLEKHFGLHQAGVVTLAPELPASIKHLRQLNEAITQEQVGCAFIEPQFNAAKVEQLAAVHDLKIGTLDPLGTSLPVGEQLYLLSMQQQVDVLEACLN